MADITVKFGDGTSHTYQGAPDSATQIQVLSRVFKDFPDRAENVAGIEGAKESGLGERLKYFATEQQFGPHGVFTSDLPQLLYGALSGPLGMADAGYPQPQTASEKKSRRMGESLPFAISPMFPSSTGKSLMYRPYLPSAAKAAAAKAAAEKAAGEAAAASKADSIINSPLMKMLAKAAGLGGSVELIEFLKRHM